MVHVLDNPIWNALGSGNQKFANGSNRTRYIKRDLGIFAALETNHPDEFIELTQQFPKGAGIILFVPHEVYIPSAWNIKLKREILQMVCEPRQVASIDGTGITRLGDEDIPAMINLTRLTNPGPFFQRTIDFGNYEGIFDEDKLVAMCGRRLQPDPYIEVSAVCTHPEHTGKGYAARLVSSQLLSIAAESKIPFLHLYPDNFTALRLYQKLGFIARKEMLVYFLEKY